MRPNKSSPEQKKEIEGEKKKKLAGGLACNGNDSLNTVSGQNHQ